MKKQSLLLLLIISVTIFTKTFAQNIAVNQTGNLPDTSAMLDVSSSNKGFLAPRMTTTQQNAIPLPAKGLLIFNTTDNGFKVNTGTTGSPVWTALATGSGSTTNLLSSSANTISSTVNGVTATAPAINSNALSLSGTNLTSTINGIASTALNLTPAITASIWSLTGNTGITQPAVPATYGSSLLGAAENYLGTTDAKDLVFATNDLERMRIMKTTGYLGIGTAAPSKPIDLVKNLTGEGLMKLQNTSASGYSSIDIWSNTTQIGNIGFSNAGATYPNAFYFATNTTNSMVFATNNSEKMRIDGTNGNIGIGQTVPGSALDVKGTLRLSGSTSGYVGFTPAPAAGNTTYTLPSADGSNGQQLTTNGSGSLSWTAASSTTGTVTSVAALTLGTTGNDLSSSVATGTTTPVITLNVPTASATNRGVLTSGDWTIFNNKQTALNGTGFVKASGTTITYDNSTYLTAVTGTSNARSAISLTTTGTSGAATYNSSTGVLNIPSYATSSGTVTSVGLTSSDISVGGGSPITTSGTLTLTLPTINSNVGTFNNVTVNGKGLVTAASNVSYLTANQAITVTATGDATGISSLSATAPSLPLTLATVNGNIGSFTNANITVNAKGLVTAVSSGTATTVGLLVDADRTTAYTPGVSYSTLIYNSAPTNVGTAYSTSTGIFTAPATGLYQIMISNTYSVSNSLNNYIIGRIIVNGSTETEVSTALTPYSGSVIYGTLHGITNVAMTSGQTASIQIGGLNNTMNPNVGTGQHTLKIIRLN
jgi:hypothetical protein